MAGTDNRRRSAINVARLTMWKMTDDTKDATTYDTDAYTWDKSLTACKRTPKMQSNQQYGDGQEVENSIVKDGGEIDIIVNGFGAGDSAFLFGETNKNGTEISNANDIVPYVCTAYYTERPDKKINLFKLPKCKYMPQGEDNNQREGTTIKYGTANIKGNYSPLISSGDDCYKRYGVDPVKDAAIVEKWFTVADYNASEEVQADVSEGT